MLSLPGLEIYPEWRKIYRDRREINLTTKEYDLLCLLAANRGNENRLIDTKGENKILGKPQK